MSTKEKVRALIYTRTSGEEGGDETSLDTQEKDCIKFCEYKGFEVLDLGERNDKGEPIKGIQDNGFSGANLNRPGIRKVIEMAKRKEFDALVVWKLDRFSRKVLDVLTVLEEFDKLSIKFISEKEPFLSTDSIFGKFLLQILSVVGELERENIKLRTQAGKISAMRNLGHWHGDPPYGFDKDENFRLIVNPDKLKIVKDLFNWAAIDGYSLRDMAKELNDRGSRTTRGNKWSGTTIRNILRNDIYTGSTVLRKKLGKEDQIVYRVEPVISKEFFERAKITLNSNRNSLRGKTKHPAHYAPYLYCAKCGGKMYPQGKYTAKGLTISYSGNRNTKEKSKTRCANCGWIKQELLDYVIVPELKRLILSPEVWINNIEEKKFDDLTPILEIEERAMNNLIKSREKIEEKYDLGFFKTKEDVQKALKEADRAIFLKQNDIFLLKQRMASQHDKDAVINAIRGLSNKFNKLDSKDDFMKLVLHTIHIDTHSRKLTIRLRLPLLKPIQGKIPETLEEGMGHYLKENRKIVEENVNMDHAKKLLRAIEHKVDQRVVVDKSLDNSLLRKKRNKYHLTTLQHLEQNPKRYHLTTLHQLDYVLTIEYKHRSFRTPPVFSTLG